MQLLFDQSTGQSQMTRSPPYDSMYDTLSGLIPPHRKPCWKSSGIAWVRLIQKSITTEIRVRFLLVSKAGALEWPKLTFHLSSHPSSATLVTTVTPSSINSIPRSKWKYDLWSPGELISLLAQCSHYLTALSGYSISHQPNTDQVKYSRQVNAANYWHKHLGSWLLQPLNIGWFSRRQLRREWQTLPFRVLKSPGVGWLTPKPIRCLPYYNHTAFYGSTAASGLITLLSHSVQAQFPLEMATWLQWASKYTV